MENIYVSTYLPLMLLWQRVILLRAALLDPQDCEPHSAFQEAFLHTSDQNSRAEVNAPNGGGRANRTAH